MVLELAETPGNLFEYYAWEYRVLRKFARHYSAGDIIPANLVESMNGAKNMLAATELQHPVVTLTYMRSAGRQPCGKKYALKMRLSLSAGSALRNKFLQHSRAKESGHLLKDFVGDSVLRYCNGGIVPNISSLCKEMNL